MPFGLRKAAQTFQHLIDQVLHVLSFTFAYIDDLLIDSSSADEHKHHLCAVFQHLDEYGIVINPLKHVFRVKGQTFLGHHVSNSGSWPLEDKVQAMRYFPRQYMQRKLREFLASLISTTSSLTMGQPY